MELTKQTVNRYGYASISIMLVLLLLLWFRLVPESLTLPFFLVALVLFVARIIMRVQLARMERKALEAERQMRT